MSSADEGSTGGSAGRRPAAPGTVRVRPRDDADLATICTWARRAGATRVELGVVPGNRPAIELYLHCGFGWDGESRGYPRMALTLSP